MIASWIRGSTFDEFDDNRMLSEAVIRCLEVIGEAVKMVPPDMRERHPEFRGATSRAFEMYLSMRISGSRWSRSGKQLTTRFLGCYRKFVKSS